MMMNVSDAEAADLGRMLQSRSWAIVMKYLHDAAVIDRKSILRGQITADRLFEIRASQAGLQRIQQIVNDVYAAGKLKTPTAFENMLG